MRNELYRIDYDIKQLSAQTLDFISIYDSELAAAFSLPELNDFIPKKLQLVSLCKK
jgi:secreted Zn-dependent insulinase-like peptidase